MVDPTTGIKLATLGRPGSLGATEVSWSPDGRTIATADTAVVFWNAATGKALHGFPARPGESLDDHSLRWTSNGRTLFFRSSVTGPMTGEGRIRSLHVETGTVGGPYAGSEFAVARGGGALFTSEPGTLWRIDLANGARHAVYREVGEGWHYTYGDLGVSADVRRVDRAARRPGDDARRGCWVGAHIVAQLSNTT